MIQKNIKNFYHQLANIYINKKACFKCPLEDKDCSKSIDLCSKRLQMMMRGLK